MNKGFLKLNHLEQKGIFCEGCGTNSGNFWNSLYHSSQFYYSTSINVRVLKVKENYFGKPIHLFTKVKRENHQILLNQPMLSCQSSFHVFPVILWLAIIKMAICECLAHNLLAKADRITWKICNQPLRVKFLSGMHLAKSKQITTITGLQHPW